MPDRDLISMLRRLAGAQPDALAFRTEERTWRFDAVRDTAWQIGQALRAEGIGPGDRVACLTRHVIETTLLTLGAASIGAVCMPVNWRLSAQEAAYILANGGARLLITDAMFAATARTAAPPGLRRLLAVDACEGIDGFEAWYLAQPATDPGWLPDPDSTALQPPPPCSCCACLPQDSPSGLAAWIVEKFHGWTDCKRSPEEALSKDEMLTNICIYWFGGRIGSSMRLYKETLANK